MSTPIDAFNWLTMAAASGHWQRGFANDLWYSPWVNQVSGLAPGGNTATTDLYDKNTDRDTRWKYDAAGRSLRDS